MEVEPHHPCVPKKSSDQDPEVRYISAYALGLSGDARAVLVLKRMVADQAFSSMKL
jgi:HEAT repeat protein